MREATAMLVAILLVAGAAPEESTRSELIRLQQKTGLSLVAVRGNKIYSISFGKRKLNELGELKTLANGETILQGGFSEDGTRVAVTLCRESKITHPVLHVMICPPGQEVLAIIGTNASDPREYPDVVNPEFMVCWSHDSSKVALVAQNWKDGTHASELQILDVETGATRLIARSTESFVDPQCWSPDDKQVVYTASNLMGHQRVSIYDLDLNTSREFSRGTRATWSPDGNWIALMDCPPSLWGCKYYAVRPSGRDRKVLFKSESATALWWSPDSRFVAYVNAASFFERTPTQQLREMVRLRVRRLDDNSVNSFADFFDGDEMYFQWLKNVQVQVGSTRSAPAN